MTVPARAAWPEPVPHTEAADLLTKIILSTFRLNARLLEAAQLMAANGGLTAAWWQVLGGVLDQPRTVAEVSRRMGVTRQGVLRIADLLVERGLAEYRPNPAHRRAQLLGLYRGRLLGDSPDQPGRASLGESRRCRARSGRPAHDAGTMQQLVDVLEHDQTHSVR